MAAYQLRHRATTLEESLGHVIPWQECANAIVEGFKQALNIDFKEQGLSIMESEKADQLCQDKYVQMDWLAKL